MKNSLLLFTCLLAQSVISQNLVPNSGFEEYAICPDGTDQLEYCTGWWNARGTCDYYNACANPGGLGVPLSVFGFQESLSGSGYAGFVAYQMQSPGYREHLTCQLIQPMSIGETYYFSFYLSLAFNGNSSNSNKACNNQGIRFSVEPFDSFSNESPVDNWAVWHNEEILADTNFWHQMKGSFVADQPYEYIVIGNFFDDASTDTTSLNQLEQGGAYYYVEDVRLALDSLFAWESLNIPENHGGIDIGLFPCPVEYQLTLKSTHPIVELFIYENAGNLVWNQVVSPTRHSVVDVSALPEGVYLIGLKLEGELFETKTFLKN